MSEAAGTRRTEAEASTVRELVAVLAARYGATFESRVAASRIVVNGTPIQFARGLRTALEPGDEVAFLVAVGGG
jgi:molybdopterin converting factor small subunit